MKPRIFFLWAVTLVVCFVLVTPEQASAQGAVTSAAITGDVTDETGAVLPGAKVTIQVQATGLTHEATADPSGHFAFLQLAAGAYDITVEASGFKTAEVRNVVVEIGETLSLKIPLEVGEMRQTIEVSGETATIGTTQAEVGNVIQTTQLRELPLNQRSFTALVTQQPNMVQMTNTSPASPTATQYNTGSLISAGGATSSSVAYLMDGVNLSHGSFTAPGTASGGDMPGVESIQEFKVLTHSYSAVYGGAAAAVVSFATRGGTNDIHGSVYEFLRNDKLDARAFFDREKPPFRRNQFGGTLGGPIRKNKTFFFVNYESLRESLTTSQIAFVPTQAARDGGVGGSSGFSVIGPIQQPDADCVDTNTPAGAPFFSAPCFLRGPVAITPEVQAILDLYPFPNGNILPGGGVGEHLFQNPQPVRQDFILGKIDHSFGPNDQLTVRYSIVDADKSSFFNLPSYDFATDDRSQNLLVKWTKTVSSSLVNTLSFALIRSELDAVNNPTTPLQPNQLTGDPARGFFGPISVGSAGNVSGSLTSLGGDNISPFRLERNFLPINDDLIYIRGTHLFKFGGMVNPMQWNWDSATILGGSYNFLSLNDLLAGNPSVLLIRNNDANPSFRIRTTQVAWYVEDAWRAMPNLTITFGLRHEFQVPILKDINNRLGNWARPEDTSITVGAPYNNYSLTQFQPRLGIAYDPTGNGKTVIRSGFGVFNDFIGYEGLAGGQLQWNSPQPVLNTTFGEPNAIGLNLIPIGIVPINFPTCDGGLIRGISGPSCVATSPFAGLVTGVIDPVNSPTSLQWHLEIERELPGQLTLTATYAGAQSFHIGRKVEANHNLPCAFVNGQPVFPTSAAVSCGTAAPAVSAIGFSLYAKRYDTNARYHSGTVQLKRNFATGFGFQASYTFSKSLSESDAFNSAGIITGVSQASQYPACRQCDRSESAFSIRNRFVENIVFDLPVGRGRKFMTDAGGAADAILGGWTISSLGEFRSGHPFSVLAGFGITGVGDNIDFPDRPDIVSSNVKLGGPNLYFDPKAFALQAPGNLGNAPRTSARGPDFANLDISIAKSFQLKESVALQFRAELFNVLNHANFAIPFNQLYIGFVPTFGSTPTQAQLDALPCRLTAAQAQVHSCNPQAGRISSTVGVPRQVQFALKLTF